MNVKNKLALSVGAFVLFLVSTLSINCFPAITNLRGAAAVSVGLFIAIGTVASLLLFLVSLGSLQIRNAKKYLVIGLFVAGAGFRYLGVHLSPYCPAPDPTISGQAELHARLGQTYWVAPNKSSTYQFVRFGAENSADSINHGLVVTDVEAFKVIRLEVREKRDEGTYQVQFANGAVKWMDCSSFNTHMQVSNNAVKTSPEIFQQDPRVIKVPNSKTAVVKHDELIGPDATSKAESAKVWFGMTEQEVLASPWGHPRSINTVKTFVGQVEIWNYGVMDFLGFRDGHLEVVANNF